MRVGPVALRPDMAGARAPFASAIDTDLPEPPQRTHLMLKYKASWVHPEIAEGDLSFELYPEESIDDWHKRNRMWIE